MRSIWILLITTTALRVPAAAQTAINDVIPAECPELRGIAAIAAKPAAARTRAEEITRIEASTNCEIRLMWPGTFKKNPPMRQPAVKAEFTATPRSPYVDRNSTIHVSVEFWQILERFAFLIAHDILISQKPAVAEAPLLYQPYASSRLLEIMQPISRYINSQSVNEIQAQFRCNDAACRAAFSLSEMGTQLFVLGHEFAHLFYGDRPGANNPKAQELRADTKAFEFLRSVVRQLPGYNPTEVQFALYAGPVMVLRYGRENPDNAGLDGFIDARIDALIKDVPKDIRYDIKNITGSYTTLETGTGVLRLKPTLKPDLVTVDGMRIPIANLDRDLSIVKGFHAIFARSGNSFAYAYPQCGWVEEVCVVPLQFHELLPAPSIRPRTPDSRDFNLERQQWFQIMLTTSDRNVQPRTTSVAWLHWRAVAALNLGNFIPADPSVPLAETSVRRIDKARREDEPLSTWRTSPSPDVELVTTRYEVEKCEIAPDGAKVSSSSAAEACVDEVDHSLVWHTNDPKAGSDFEYRYRNTCSRPVSCSVTVTSGERARFAGMSDAFHPGAHRTYACTLKPDGEKWVAGSLSWDRKPDTMPSMDESLSCSFKSPSSGR